jgi:amidase
MPFFGQEIFDIEADIDVSSPDAPQPDFDGGTYNQALDGSAAFGANVDQILATYALDAIVAPTGDLAWATDLYYTDRFTFGSSYIAAIPGYPNIQVPASTVFGLPFGVSFMGTAFSEPTLIKLASGFEAVTQARVEPTFAPTILPDHVKGVPLLRKHRGQRAFSHHRPI